MGRRHSKSMIGARAGTVLRRFLVSRDIARALIAAALLIVAIAVSAATTRVLATSVADPRPGGAQPNALFETEIETMRAELLELRGALDDLAAKDEYFRLLAGLEPIDDHVHAIGIGGPGTGSLTRHPLYRFDEASAERAFTLSTEVNDLLRRARLLSISWQEARDTLQLKYDRLASMPSISPTNGYVSSGFSHRRIHPILSQPRPHLGIDIAARHGAPIVATARGRVRYVGYAGEYGLTIEIDHGYGHATRYAHASRATVRAGQPVERGDMIGHVGDTGLSVGPHVHYEVLVNGNQANPRNYILDFRVVPD